MFGEFILISGGILISACTSRYLEHKGKTTKAAVVDVSTKTGLLIFAAKKVNELFEEFLNL